MLETNQPTNDGAELEIPQSTGIETAVVPKTCTSGSLDLMINDMRGRPIPSLSIQVKVDGKIIFDGASDVSGQIPKIEAIDLGSRFEIHVKKDAGGYKLAAIGTMEAEETYACLKSPRLRFEFTTYAHEGTAGGAAPQKQKTITSHNQNPSQDRQIFGTDKPPEIKEDRNDKGHPKASVLEGLRDSFNRNIINGAAPNTSSTDLEYVQKLIEFGEKQAKWRYEDSITSNAYILQMNGQTFKEPVSKSSDGYKTGVRGCNKYVKIALWYAGYNPPLKKGEIPVSIGSGVSPARLMGPELEKAGFKNVTDQLPDARWAAPGDVIVYKRTAAPNDPGHIDIRTYDGYLSDFLGLYLPYRQFTVTGIYRKYSDLLPEKRMRAFLMVIASREAKTIFLKDGYKETYRTLPDSGKFNSFKTHPFADRSKVSSASGAYGIIVQTWKSNLPFLALSTKEDQFSANVQDRIAVVLMEQNHNALALVRQGKIEEAARSLATIKYIQWPSLPGGDQSKGYTVAQMMDAYNTFLRKVE